MSKTIDKSIEQLIDDVKYLIECPTKHDTCYSAFNFDSGTWQEVLTKHVEVLITKTRKKEREEQ